MKPTEVIQRFEDEFKNLNNLGVVDELMTVDFVHHLPVPGLPVGPEGRKAVGRLITDAIADIEVTVDLLFSDGDLGADRVSGVGRRRDTGQPVISVESHIYRVSDGRIIELWPAGGPDLPQGGPSSVGRSDP